MKSLALILLGVALAAIAGLIGVQHFYAPSGLQLEVAKALLNILTVAVVGQAVAFMVALHNESRRKEAEADQLRHRALDALNQAFMSAKRVRRRARARSTLVSSSCLIERRITKSQYYKYLEELNDVQLTLEILAKDLETNANLFKEGPKTFSLVSSMEEYLNEMVDEWEQLNVQFTGEPASVDTKSLRWFNDFIGDYRTSEFRPKFVHSYYAAIERIRASLVTAKSESWKHNAKPDDKAGETAGAGK
jgi:hypothetical protein